MPPMMSNTALPRPDVQRCVSESKRRRCVRSLSLPSVADGASKLAAVAGEDAVASLNQVAKLAAKSCDDNAFTALVQAAMAYQGTGMPVEEKRLTTQSTPPNREDDSVSDAADASLFSKQWSRASLNVSAPSSPAEKNATVNCHLCGGGNDGTPMCAFPDGGSKRKPPMCVHTRCGLKAPSAGLPEFAIISEYAVLAEPSYRAGLTSRGGLSALYGVLQRTRRAECATCAGNITTWFLLSEFEANWEKARAGDPKFRPCLSASRLLKSSRSEELRAVVARAHARANNVRGRRAAASKKPRAPSATELSSEQANDLPQGWILKVFQRESSSARGRKYRHWYSPKTKKRFRSKAEVKLFLSTLEVVEGDEDTAWLVLHGRDVGTKKRKVANDKGQGKKALRLCTMDMPSRPVKERRAPSATELSSGPATGLPEGWTVKLFQRESGSSKGTTDRYWYSPQTKKKFRSMPEVKRFLTVLEATAGNEIVAWKTFKGRV